ncbi:MAG: response regulator [Lachnospiraceae bacterium]
MMNLLLVEDEPPILRALKSSILSFEEHFIIAQAFTNGKAALDYLEKNAADIDVLITDIQIPVINGLELIEAVKKQWPHITSVIITGFDSFAYAQKSISLSVSNYLLKPIDEDALYRELIKIMEQKYQSAINTPSLNQTDNIDFMKQNHETGHFCIAVLCRGNYPYPDVDFSKCDSSYLQRSCADYLLPCRQIKNYWCFPLNSLAGELVVIALDEHLPENKKQAIHEFFEPLLHLDTAITIVYSFHTTVMKKMNLYINDLLSYLSRNIIIGESQLLCLDQQSPAEKKYSLKDLNLYTSRLSEFYRNSNIKLFRAELKQLIKELKRLNCSQLFVSQYFIHLLNVSLAGAEVSPFRSMETTETIHTAVFYSDHYEALYENLLSIFSDYIYDQIDSIKNNLDKQQILLKIEHYIYEHYTENIGIQQIAEVFHFTPSYLSKIFKEYQHVTPTEFMIKLKIEKAKELLRLNPSLIIKEVAGLVGYEDSLYFSKVFKKETGISPKQYAKEWKQKNSFPD